MVLVVVRLSRMVSGVEWVVRGLAFVILPVAAQADSAEYYPYIVDMAYITTVDARSK
jgi:purine nucleoside permease